MFFHAGFAWFAGGFVGVDVFFVVSGYLITSILVEDLATGRFSIARFYERRARRILPALFFVLLCTSVASWFLMLPTELEDFSRTLVSVVLFVSNVYIWRDTGYFDPAAEFNPLLHTWSLAVEEQFYIGFPIVLFAIWRFGPSRMAPVLLTLSMLSLLLAEWGWRTAPTANFFLLPTRAWELGVGALCAVLLRNRPPRPRSLLAGAGLALIAASVLAFDARTPFPSLYALLPVGGTALVILHATGGTPVAKLLSIRLLVGVGLISYGAYLWHQPLIAFARIRHGLDPAPALLLALIAVAFLLAYVSWRLVELPFRRGGSVLPSGGSVLAASTAAAVAFLGLGLYGQSSDGRMQAWLAAQPDRADVYGMYAEAMRVHDARWDDGGCQFNVTELDDATIERLRSCRQRHGPGLAVLGDSHAIDIFIGMDRLHEGDFVFGLTFWSCWLGNPRRNCDFETFASLLEHEPGTFRRVLFHQAGFRFLESVDGRNGRGMFERVPEEGAIRAEEFRILRDSLDEGVGYLLRLSELTELVWIGPRIEPHIGLRFVLENGCDHPYRLRDGLAALFSGLDAHLAAFAGKAGVKYVSLIDEVGLEMPADFMTCDEIYWRDGDHWSLEGAERFVGRLVDATQIAFRSSCNGSAPMCTPSVPCCTE